MLKGFCPIIDEMVFFKAIFFRSTFWSASFDFVDGINSSISHTSWEPLPHSLKSDFFEAQQKFLSKSFYETFIQFLI